MFYGANWVVSCLWFPRPLICTDTHATHATQHTRRNTHNATHATSAGGQSSRDTQVGLSVLHEAVLHFHDPKGKSVTPQPFGDVLCTLAGDEWIARLHHVVESHRREVRVRLLTRLDGASSLETQLPL